MPTSESFVLPPPLPPFSRSFRLFPHEQPLAILTPSITIAESRRTALSYKAAQTPIDAVKRGPEGIGDFPP